MNRKEAEQLAKYIKKDGKHMVDVLGIELIGNREGSSHGIDYFVKCSSKKHGLSFVVKSLQQWESRKAYLLDE